MKNKINYSNKDRFIENIIYTFCLILPVFLIAGSFLTELSIVIISLSFLTLSLKKKLYFYYNNVFTKVFLIFFLILIICSFFSVDQLTSLKKTLVYFRYWLFSLAIWYISKSKKNFIRNLMYAFALCYFVLIIDGFYQYFMKVNILGWPIVGTRVSSLFGDELILGSYLSRILPIFFATVIFSKDLKNNAIYYLFFLITFICIEVLTFLSGERIAFFYINLSAIFLIITMKNYKMFRALSLAISLILILIISNISPAVSDRMINKTINQLGLKNDSINDGIKAFSNEHQNHFKSALKMFNEHKVTGIGPRMFRYNCNREEYKISFESCSNHPHNNYIQVLSEMGIIGFIFVIYVILIFSFQISKYLYYKYYKKIYIFSDFQLALLSAILISIWPIAPTGDFFNNWLSVIYFLPLGLFLNSIHKKKDY